MESGGNSGSLQSSSGGDEEYDDSRAGAALSIFMNTNSPSHLRPILTPPSLFEPVSNYIELQNPNASSLNLISEPWSRSATMRSDPKHATIFAENNDHLRATAARGHGSRKRSRATRRNPTTVLTTDTTNFRAMVQEFTGIPSPPFNATSTTTSSFDLFRTRTRSTHFEPPYLRRQKVESPLPLPFLVPSTTPINSYQLPMPMPMQLIQSSNLFQNPNITTITSLLQYSNPKFLIPSSYATMPTNHEFHDFDFNLDENQCFTALSGLPNLISPDNNSESNHREIKTTRFQGEDDGCAGGFER